MLKMKCPKCGAQITSPLLGEVEEIDCPSCQGSVPVKDVIVFAKGFSYARTQLRNHLYRYKDLLSEAKKDQMNLENDPTASSKSKATSQQLVLTLEEIMAGARSSFRMEFLQMNTVTYQSGHLKGTGYLENLSMGGACIKIDEKEFLPNKKQDILITLSLPGMESDFSICGYVAWSGHVGNLMNQHKIGIKFVGMDMETKALLWSYLKESSAQIAC